MYLLKPFVEVTAGAVYAGFAPPESHAGFALVSVTSSEAATGSLEPPGDDALMTPASRSLSSNWGSDVAGDVWALGMTMLCLASGALPKRLDVGGSGEAVYSESIIRDAVRRVAVEPRTSDGTWGAGSTPQQRSTQRRRELAEFSAILTQMLSSDPQLRPDAAWAHESLKVLEKRMQFHREQLQLQTIAAASQQTTPNPGAPSTGVGVVRAPFGVPPAHTFVRRVSTSFTPQPPNSGSVAPPAPLGSLGLPGVGGSSPTTRLAPSFALHSRPSPLTAQQQQHHQQQQRYTTTH